MVCDRVRNALNWRFFELYRYLYPLVHANVTGLLGQLVQDPLELLSVESPHGFGT